MRIILFKSGGSLELAFRAGDHFWRYVLMVTASSMLFDFAMLSSIMSARAVHGGRDGLKSRYFFSHIKSIASFLA